MRLRDIKRRLWLQVTVCGRNLIAGIVIDDLPTLRLLLRQEGRTTTSRFDSGPHTPANLPRGARANLIRNIAPVVNRPIGTPSTPARVQTPTSPLEAISRAAAMEGAQRATVTALSETPSPGPDQPVSLAESADRLLQVHVESFDAQ